MLQRMVVTDGSAAAASETDKGDPFVVAVLPMALKVAGGPVTQIEAKPSYADQKALLFMGHGMPGLLGGRNGKALADELTDGTRSLSPGTEVHLWSCYAGARPKSDDSLVEALTKELEAKKVGDVKVSGVTGVSWTNTATGALLSGPAMNSPQEEQLVRLQHHYLVDVGLIAEGNQKSATINKAPRMLKVPKTPPPLTVADAVKALEVNKGQKIPATEAERVSAVRAAIVALDAALSNDPDVKKLTEQADPGSSVLIALRTATA